jgi:hypothetical protein
LEVVTFLDEALAGKASLVEDAGMRLSSGLVFSEREFNQAKDDTEAI